MISYALSMIPPWREALERALDVLAPGGSLHLVDFGHCAGLPGPFRTGLRRWLAAFDVTPRDDLGAALEALSAERGLTCEIETRFRGYAVLAVARPPFSAQRGRWPVGPDGVSPTAATQVWLQKRQRERAPVQTCFPHPIRPHGPPSPAKLGKGSGGLSRRTPARG